MNRNKINFNPLIYGIATGVAMWVVMLLCDFIDETLKIDVLSGFALVISPLILMYMIITHKLKKSIGGFIRKKVLKREKKEVKKETAGREYIMYLTSYNLSFLFIWNVIWKAISSDTFFISQHHIESASADLNGTEYFLYGWTAVIFFDIIIAVFAVIYMLIKFIKKIIERQKMYKELNER